LIPQAALFSYFRKANFMVALLSCRVIEMSLDNGFSKYSPLAFVFFSNFVLGQRRFQEANKFGKIALALLKRFDEPSLVPSVYISYYGFTAVFFEPLQLVAEQLRKGMDIGMSIGDTDKALTNGLHYIQKAFAGGENLSTLLSSIDYRKSWLNSLMISHYNTLTLQKLTMTNICIVRRT
jgi:hypothetical protein